MGVNAIERRDQSVLLIMGMPLCLTTRFNYVEMEKNVEGLVSLKNGFDSKPVPLHRVFENDVEGWNRCGESSSLFCIFFILNMLCTNSM
jgi:hypothetical protein